MSSNRVPIGSALRLRVRTLLKRAGLRRGVEPVDRVLAVMSGHRHRGHVDLAHGGRVAGWAADLDQPLHRAEVEVFVRGARVGSVKADRYRRDLEQAGIGDGCHAFEYDFAPALAGEAGPVSVGIRGTKVRLAYRDAETFVVEPPPLVEPPPIIRYVAADIVNNCNLRCPFCVVDYSGVRHTETMTEETFLRLISLLPVVPSGGFWMSCLHEPTLHPRLDDFIELIPPEYRHKAWFTTNLVRPLGDETFRRWARSGLHHINVSLDTMEEELFPVLRKFGRYKSFRDNLDRMTSIFGEEPKAPKLRYITIAFRSNFDEIERIVEHSNKRWLSSENEIRYTINASHITDEFRQLHYLAKEDWPTLTKKLAKLPYRYSIVYPPVDGYEEIIEPSANYFEIRPGPDRKHFPKLERPIELRARPNGKLVIVGKESEFSMNIHDIEDPVEHFRLLTEPERAS